MMFERITIYIQIDYFDYKTIYFVLLRIRIFESIITGIYKYTIPLAILKYIY